MPIDEKDLLEQQQMKRQEANALWDALDNKMKTTSLEGPASSRGLGYIYGVPKLSMALWMLSNRVWDGSGILG